MTMGTSKEELIEDWREFLEKASTSTPESCKDDWAFIKSIRKKFNESPIGGIGLLAAWAANRPACFRRVWPFLMRDFEVLSRIHMFSDVDVLTYVQERIKDVLENQDRYVYRAQFNPEKWKGEWVETIEAAVLERSAWRMVNCRSETVRPGDRVPDIQICKPLIRLVIAFTDIVERIGTIEGPSLEIGTELGKFVAAYMNDLAIVGLLTSDNGRPPKAFRILFGQHLPPFINLMSTVHTELATTLNALQAQSGLHGIQAPEQIDDGMANDLNALAYYDNIIDTSIVPTRAALFIFLNAMLTGRLICDDTALFTFLNARYGDNVSTLLVDLITATFDVLGNAANRNEPQASINACRSFLANKLPGLMEYYAPMVFPPMTVESCITDALNRLNLGRDSYANQSDVDLLGNSIQDAKVDFICGCALFKLIPESSLEVIHGDMLLQGLPEVKYTKAGLIEQCSANPNRIESLIADLEKTDGNGGEVAVALVEIIQTLCLSKDTMTLKSICNALFRKTQGLDTLLLFADPITVLQPLCQLLNDWQDQEEQSEYHPVYDEFGSILLLILILRHRFLLQDKDLGIIDPNSFLCRYFRSGSVPQIPKDMPDVDRQRLRAWIKGLYETEGISDELMSTCSPKDFHLLVATIFDQSLMACQAGVLTQDNIKGVFEYLLEPFLLPSLVAVLGWATRRLWETRPLAPHLDILLPILLTLIQPSTQLSNDASQLHEVVLAIAAKPLERALAHVLELHPKRKDVDKLTKALEPYLAAPTRADKPTSEVRAAATDHAVVESWCATADGGLSTALRNALEELTKWSDPKVAARTTSDFDEQNPKSVPQYTHRQLLFAAQLLGVPGALQALLDGATRLLAERRATSDVMLDVLTALLCAPAAAPPRSGLTLRDALHALATDAYTLSKEDATRAELVVRLQRRVEAQAPPRAVTAPPANETAVGAEEAAVAAAAGNMVLDVPVEGMGTDGSLVDVSAGDGSGMDLDGILKGVDSGLGTSGSLMGPNGDALFEMDIQ